MAAGERARRPARLRRQSTDKQRSQVAAPEDEQAAAADAGPATDGGSAADARPADAGFANDGGSAADAGQEHNGAPGPPIHIHAADRVELVPSPEQEAVRRALGAVSAIVPLGLFAADAKGRCWYVNQPLVNATGFEWPTAGEAHFQVEWEDIAVPEQGFAGGTPARLHIRHLRDDGVELDEASQPAVDFTARVIKQLKADGSTTGYVGVIVSNVEPGEKAGEGTGHPAPPSGLRLLHTFEPLVQILLDSTPDVITVLDADGSWRYSNAAAWRLFGYREDFDPRTGVFDLIHPDDLALAAAQLDWAVATPGAASGPFELRVLAQDGTWHYLECTSENLTEDPVVRGIVVRSRDVTDQRSARLALLDANERMSTLVASLHIAALVEDENRIIVLTNQAFLDLFELASTPEQLVGSTLENISAELTRRFGDPTRGHDPERVNRVLRERRRVIGDRLSLPDGRELERDYVPIYVNHEYRGHLWLFRDVSDQVRSETLSTKLLAIERQENRRLVEQEQLKASFLAEISHELRTPLTSILSFTELLRDGVLSDEPSEQVEFLDVITRNAERLMRLVDDLILLDRAESGALSVDWQAVDVTSLVEKGVATFAPQAEAKQIVLESEVGDGPPIPADNHKLAQMLDVLLSNAVKYTPEAGRITVTTSAADAHWLISVADTGIGVPAAECEALFERFYRASNARAARIPGSGLGLSVARAIARLHNGEITISSREGGGTVALVAIPIADEIVPAGRPTDG